MTDFTNNAKHTSDCTLDCMHIQQDLIILLRYGFCDETVVIMQISKSVVKKIAKTTYVLSYLTYLSQISMTVVTRVAINVQLPLSA
jgi:hypothetical protein